MAIFKYKNADGTWETVESPGAVKYTEQSLSETEQQIARDNIGAYVEEEVLALGNLSTMTLPDGKTWGDYDLVFIQFCSSNGTPAGGFTAAPKATFAIPTWYGIDINGTILGGVLSNIHASGSGISIVAPYANAPALPKMTRIIGYKFKKHSKSYEFKKDTTTTEPDDGTWKEV